MAMSSGGARSRGMVVGAPRRAEVVLVRMAIANAYLVRGDRPIVVDTGAPGSARAILRALTAAGSGPRDVSLILLTHGHADHFGSAAELRRLTGAPLAIHELDAGALRSGRNPYLPPTRLRGRLLTPFLPHRAPPIEPDLVFRGELDLGAFGVAGRVIGTPGHTAGSVSVLLPDGAAIVADLLMGGHLGGAFHPRVPRYHYFAEDLHGVRHSIAAILDEAPTTIFVGHGGPLDPEAVRGRFANEIGARSGG